MTRAFLRKMSQFEMFRPDWDLDFSILRLHCVEMDEGYWMYLGGVNDTVRIAHVAAGEEIAYQEAVKAEADECFQEFLDAWATHDHLFAAKAIWYASGLLKLQHAEGGYSVSSLGGGEVVLSSADYCLLTRTVLHWKEGRYEKR